jgi:hypothetical protein
MKLPKWLETKVFQEIESIERSEDIVDPEIRTID